MKLSPALISPPLALLYRLWCATLRIKQHRREYVENSAGKALLCLWHAEMFSVIAVRENMKFCALVSPSRDGEYLARVLRKLGLITVSGSSSRGGSQAVQQILRLSDEEKYITCITPDGPRGPALRVKPGIIFMAAHSGLPVIPVRAIARRSKRFKSWDRFVLPLPFSRVDIYFGPPMHIPAETLDKAHIREHCRALEDAMNALEPGHGI